MDNGIPSLPSGPANAPRRVRPVPAVSRAIAILRLLGKSSEPLGVNAIARALRLVPSTCLHILRALHSEELVAFDPVAKRYSLDAGVLTIARSFMRSSSFAQIAQPGLSRVADHFGITAIGVQVMGLDHMVAVAIAPSSLPLRLHVEIGSRFPALISATGRCLAAFGGYPWSDLRSRFRALRWHCAPSLSQWRGEIEAAKEHGYSIDEGNYIQGVTILAVPVLNPLGRMAYGIVAAGVSQQMTAIGVIGLAEHLRGLAAAIAERLWGTTGEPVAQGHLHGAEPGI